MAIVLLVAVVILSSLLKVAGFFLGFAIKALIILLLVAIVIRFVTLVRGRRQI